MYVYVRVTTQVFFCIAFLFACESKGGSAYIVEEGISKKKALDSSSHYTYSWLQKYDFRNSIVNRIALPDGYERLPVEEGSFGDWLRHFPLKTGDQTVYLYNGEKKANQSAQFAILDLDVGKTDLQQCADAVMRLKAEYHYSKGENRAIHFNFTSGDEASYIKWSQGYRPRVTGNTVVWVKTASPDVTYKSFKAYMKQVFMYAGTSSLSKEMAAVNSRDMRIGDVFIRGGFPGHAVIVLDMAIRVASGEKIFLLAQSYMPAQDMHVLKNPSVRNSPWYSLEGEGDLVTPEWRFKKSELKRFK